MSPDRSALAGFRKGNERDLARRSGQEPERTGPEQSDDVDLDTLIAQRRAATVIDGPLESVSSGEPEVISPAIRDEGTASVGTSRLSLPGEDREVRTHDARADVPGALFPKTVRTMSVPPDVLVGLRVMSARRNMDHPDVVMAAVAEFADLVPPAEVEVKRRRRLHTERLLVKLTAEQTALIDQLAAERRMTRSTFITAVLGRYVAGDAPS